MALSSEERAIDISNYAFIASMAVLYYDYLLTLPAEIAHVWPRVRTPGALWFLANRYLSVLGSATSFAFAWRATTAAECDRYSLSHQLVITAAQLLVMVLLFIRTYALYERSRRILFVLLGAVGTLGGASLWTLGVQKTEPIVTLGRGCHLRMPYSTAVRVSGIWWAQFAFDALVFTLTLARTWHTRLPSSRAARERDLLYVLRRDGAMYFGAMALANLAVIISFYCFHEIAKGALAPLASALSVTLISRLLLNLHRAAAPHMTYTARAASGRTSRLSAFLAGGAGVLSTHIGDVEPRQEAEVGGAGGRVREGGRDWWAGEVERGVRLDEEDGRATPPGNAGVEMAGLGTRATAPAPGALTHDEKG